MKKLTVYWLPPSVRSVFVLTIAAVVSCGGNVEQGSGSEGHGTDGSGGDAPASAHASCANQTPGADRHCGINGDDDCCATLLVPGGTFNRYNNPKWPATVSDFRLGKMEVTVGRVRAFVNAWPNAWPKPGDGANPHVTDSGWQTDWDQYLPQTKKEFVNHMHCPYVTVPASDHTKDVTWTDAPGPNEQAAANCITWFEMFAFCAWDGGRLPSEAELNRAIVGGDEQRIYPWGPDQATEDQAVLSFTPNGAFVPVGHRPAGAARWGHLDFGGSRMEFVRDTYAPVDKEGRISEPPTICKDCEAMSPYDSMTEVIVLDRSWKWKPSMAQIAKYRGAASLTHEFSTEGLGFRCAYPIKP